MNEQRRRALLSGRASLVFPGNNREWDVFLLGRVAAWRRESGRFTLLEFLGMTELDYAEWVTDDYVTFRVRRSWMRRRNER